MSSFCRACLASDIKMYSLENSVYKIYYEKLLQTNSKPSKQNLVCYICYALLQRCHSFLLMARYSENTLQILHEKGIQATKENIGQNPLRFTLSRITIQAIDNTENDTDGNRLEPIDEGDIKLEPTCTDIPDEKFIKDEPIESTDLTVSPNISDAEDETVFIDSPPADIETLYTCIPRRSRCQKKKSHLANNKTYNRVVYSCHLCDKILLNKRSIILHIYAHIGYQPYRCDICHKKFTHSQFLTIHMKRHNEIKPYKCHICDKTFSLKNYLTKHLKAHKTRNETIKPHISHISDAEDEMVFSDSPPADIETLYTCIPRSDQCQEKESNLANNKTHNQVLYSCHLCDKILRNKKSIILHIYAHIGYKPFRCNICHKKFTDSQFLTIHMKRHNEIKPYKCHICDKTFSLKNYLTKHLKAHKEITYCSVSNKNFKKSYLSTHMKIHQGTEVCYCDYCKKKFFSKATLREHMKTHEGQSRQFACQWCDKSFKNKCLLTNHEMTHTNAKPFECEVCKKTLTQKQNLKVHMRLHTGEKPYGCSKCDKKFHVKSVMLTHERNHTGERPFSCERCHKRYNHKSVLVTHLRKCCKMSDA